MTDSTTTAQDMLRRVLLEETPGSYLVIGDPSPLRPGSDGDEAAAISPTHLGLTEATEQLPSLGRQDLALVGHLEQLDRPRGEVLISRLRDLYARRVLVQVITGKDWREQDLTALGFTRLFVEPNSDYVLFGFDVGTYKTTPDWLNPRYWANPEMWGKHRW